MADSAGPNVWGEHWEHETADAPFRVKATRVGARAGAEKLGAAVYEIAPGGRASPLHVHHANEEMVIVLAGRPTFRGEHDSRELEVGEVVACPMGRRGAHRIDNNSEEPARVLIVSTMNLPEVAEQLDSGKVLAMTVWPDQVDEDGVLLAFRRGDAVGYMEGEME